MIKKENRDRHVAAAVFFLTGCSSEDRVYYDTCDDARAAGVAPLHQGDPGYRAGLDRNHDGIACND
jgi:Excalibur calcium-binding domain